jgi:hypothetical protein
VSIFSDNDPFVQEDNWEAFRKLGEIIVLHGRGHIEDPFEQEVLKAVQNVITSK